MTRTELVRAYYAALEHDDQEAIAACFTADAVHYFTRLQPQRGGAQIAGSAIAAIEHLQARWRIENAIEQGDQAVIEFSMLWRDFDSGEERLDRGTEWFLFEGDKIAEVRAYHHGSARNPHGDLIGFDHAGRGYTVLEEEAAQA